MNHGVIELKNSIGFWRHLKDVNESLIFDRRKSAIYQSHYSFFKSVKIGTVDARMTRIPETFCYHKEVVLFPLSSNFYYAKQSTESNGIQINSKLWHRRNYPFGYWQTEILVFT